VYKILLLLVLIFGWIYFRLIRGTRRRGKLHGRELLRESFRARRRERIDGAETWDERRRLRDVVYPKRRIASRFLRGDTMDVKRVAALCSHGGSNFAAIADAASRGEIPIQVAVMVHNNARAGAKQKAIARGIPTEWVPRKRFADEEAYASRLLEILEQYRIDIIALAGFMQRIPSEVIQRYAGRITNIHPALLPAYGGRGFYGMKVHQAVFAAGAKVSGPTVHLVDEEYDHGPILLQRAVSIADCTCPEEIAARVLIEEHKLYPEVLGLLARERFRIEGDRVTLLSEEEPAAP